MEPGVRDRPILFSAPMVRAILEGRKTQTRRLVRDGIAVTDICGGGVEPVVWWPRDARGKDAACQYGAPGDRLWVRETWTHIRGNGIRTWYRADGEPTDREGNVLPTTPGYPRWRPSIYMARKDSRITLEVTDVRVQRLQDITEDAARAEGIQELNGRFTFNGGLHESRTARDSFEALWDSINGDRAAWAANPWVWVVSFCKQD